jgi:hypothetical protein
MSVREAESISGKDEVSDIIGNRTHDISACSVVPQPAGLLRAPEVSVLEYSYFTAASWLSYNPVPVFAPFHSQGQS